MLHEALATALRVAVDLPRPDVASLQAAGIRPWDALALMRRLLDNGDVRNGAWIPEAQQRHRKALEKTSDPTAQRALERRELQDRPRERALRSGIEDCDDADLLALILRSDHIGVLERAQRLLVAHGGLIGLSRLSIEQLQESDGLGEAKATELAAAFELGRRLASSRMRERPSLSNPDDIAKFLTPLMASLPHEELWVLPMDSSNRVIGDPRQVTRGDVDGTDAGPRPILRIVLTAGATKFVLAHNHPSGDPTPSQADIAVTKRLAIAARTMDLSFLDHIIIAQGNSFAAFSRTFPEHLRG